MRLRFPHREAKVPRHPDLAPELLVVRAKVVKVLLPLPDFDVPALKTPSLEATLDKVVGEEGEGARCVWDVAVGVDAGTNDLAGEGGLYL